MRFSVSSLLILVVSLFCITFGLVFRKVTMGNSAPKEKDSRTIFDFEVEDSTGQTISLSKFKGKKAYVIVNTASG